MKRAGYGHAEKLRAAMTHIFGREFEWGTHEWLAIDSEDPNSAYRGNPSLTNAVSEYMVCLQRRKVSTASPGIYVISQQNIDGLGCRFEVVRLRQ